MTNKKGFRLAVWAMAALFAFAADGRAQTCLGGAKWGSVAPAVNLDHVFCGEIKRGKAKGLHSAPKGELPPTVESFKTVHLPNADGVYVGKPTLAIRGETREKRGISSMFPDACSLDQVQASIRHAAANPIDCPRGTSKWVKCGRSGLEGEDGYCLGDSGRPLVVGIGFLKTGAINTAFPIR